MQKGMHETFHFPINCFSTIEPLNDPKFVIGKWERECITDNNPVGLLKYEAFESIEIIPSLLKCVESIMNNENKDKHIELAMEWMKKWGYLYKGCYFSIDDGEFYGQDFHSFITESIEFYYLWNLYKNVANRNKDELKKKIIIKKEDNSSYAVSYHIYYQSEYAVKIEQINDFNGKSDTKDYQLVAMYYLRDSIEEKLGSHMSKSYLFSSQTKLKKTTDNDNIQLTPGLRFNNLIEVIYMQFFILLSENEKKICPVCNKPFVPERKDKKYCSDTCKLTAKSRRYRERKNEIL